MNNTKREECEDAISRKSLIENLNKFAPEHYSRLIDSLIEKEPSVQPARKETGHWIDEGFCSNHSAKIRYRCSECGNRIFAYRIDDFCKFCGADMRRDKND